MDKKTVCLNCREQVTYSIKAKRKRLKKGKKVVKFESFYAVCDKCGEHVYIPEIHDKDVESYNEAYKSLK